MCASKDVFVLLLLLSFFGPRRMKPQTPLKNKNVRSFSQIERIFFARVASERPQKLICVLTKRRRRQRYLERKNTTTTTTTTTTPGAPSSLRKRRIQVRGRGSDDRGSFFDAPPDAMIGDHDGYKWRKYGQKNIKSASYPRSYYRCTRPDCPARKQVENGVAKYENEHNHEKPSLLLHSQKTDLHRAKSGKVEKKKSKGAMIDDDVPCVACRQFFFFFSSIVFFGCRLSFDRSK